MTIDYRLARALLSARRISFRSLSLASGISATALSPILAGAESLGPSRIQRLRVGLERLGFSAAEIRKILEPTAPQSTSEAKTTQGKRA